MQVRRGRRQRVGAVRVDRARQLNHSGRVDARQDQTDVESFAALEPVADGFRNYNKGNLGVPTEALLPSRR